MNKNKMIMKKKDFLFIRKIWKTLKRKGFIPKNVYSEIDETIEFLRENDYSDIINHIEEDNNITIIHIYGEMFLGEDDRGNEKIISVPIYIKFQKNGVNFTEYNIISVKIEINDEFYGNSLLNNFLTK